MKKHIIYALINLCIIIILFKESLCLDPQYETCVPKDCGDGLKITYPFVVHNMQDPSCGYPGFNLMCTNGSPTIRLSQNDYVVKHIEYDKNYMRLVHFQDSTNCLSKVRNLTLDPLRFVVGDTTNELVFLRNCTYNILPGNLTRYKTGSCIDQLVMLRDDRHLRTGLEYCERQNTVVVPVEELDSERQNIVVDGGNYEAMIERGFTVRWSAADCGECEHSGGRCGFNMTTLQFRCFCSDRPHRLTCTPENKKTRVRVKGNLSYTTPSNRFLNFIQFKTSHSLFDAAVLSVGAATILLLIILFFIRKFKWKRYPKNHLNVENFLKNHEFLARTRYSYSQVKKMTNSFEVKLGQGSFGIVYRGQLCNGNLVAVKILGKLKGNGEDFINEVASVGRTSHVNIVNLVGFCLEGNRIALIYEFMPNGSLEKFIYGRDSSSNCQIGWEKLHQIAVGIARGLEYLHSGCNTRILHFDIKPHNILLDQDFCPKISDFGLAKMFPEKRSMITMSHMRGTPGYIAPELYSRNFGPVTHKSDVYSYGMMILEMVGGRKNINAEVDHTSEIYFPHWIYKKVESHEEQLGLHEIVSDEENAMVKTMIIVGLWCIQTNPVNRPAITRVLEMLAEEPSSLEIPPKPYLSSPPRSMGSTSTD